MDGLPVPMGIMREYMWIRLLLKSGYVPFLPKDTLLPPSELESMDGRHYHCSIQPLAINYLALRDTGLELINGSNHWLSPTKDLIRKFEEEHTCDRFTLLSSDEAEYLLNDDYYLKHICKFGYYQQLISLFKIRKEVSLATIYAFSATERYDMYASIAITIRAPDEVIALVDSMDHALKIIHADWILQQFLNYYIIVAMVSDSKLPYIHFVSKRENETHNMCLGYLMIFCASIIINKLKSIDRFELEEILMHCSMTRSCILNEEYVNTKLIFGKIKSKLAQTAKMIKKWNCDIMEKIGMQYVCGAFNWYCSGIYNCNHHTEFYLMGKTQCLLKRRYDLANQYFVISACITDDLYERVLSLKSLSSNCYLNGQYLIGLKVLRCVYKLCNGYILPSFVKKYFTEKTKFVQQISKLNCFNCNARRCKLRVCKACMKAVYCSVLCQKIHWKKTHRDQCDKVWYSKNAAYRDLYSMLQKTILKRLKFPLTVKEVMENYYRCRSNTTFFETAF
eukprot:153904_1